MKITKEVQQTIRVVKDIICNKCGESCIAGYAGSEDRPQFEGLIEAEVSGGYFSKKVGDMSLYVFSLCETCFMDLHSTFKISAYVGDYLDDCCLDPVDESEK